MRNEHKTIKTESWKEVTEADVRKALTCRKAEWIGYGNNCPPNIIYKGTPYKTLKGYDDLYGPVIFLLDNEDRHIYTIAVFA